MAAACAGNGLRSKMRRRTSGHGAGSKTTVFFYAKDPSTARDSQGKLCKSVKPWSHLHLRFVPERHETSPTEPRREDSSFWNIFVLTSVWPWFNPLWSLKKSSYFPQWTGTAFSVSFKAISDFSQKRSTSGGNVHVALNVEQNQKQNDLQGAERERKHKEPKRTKTNREDTRK